MKKFIGESGNMQHLLHDIDIVLIGGSAGSLSGLMSILKCIREDFTIPVIIVIHRQRNVLSELTKILGSASRFKKIIEPDDKEAVGNGCIYVAPQNYHLLIEKDKTFSLDYSEPVQYSRPSIDVTFESVAQVYKNKVVAILLSGANTDGTEGLESIVENGGIAIAQDPATADYPAMPSSAIKSVIGIKVLNAGEIADFLNELIIKRK